MKLALATMTKSLSAIALIVLATIGGCNDASADLAREAADRQAAQNVAMAELQREVATGTRQLVEEEGAARVLSLEIHRDLQAERAQVAAGWNVLEAERQSIARSRRTDSFWAAVLPAGGGVVAAALALAFAWLVLFGLRRCDDSADFAAEFLVEQLFDPRRALVERELTPAPPAPSTLVGRVAGLLESGGAAPNTDSPSHQEQL